MSFDYERHDASISRVTSEVQGADSIEALSKLLRLPWFARAWTFQEAACHQRDRPALIFHGSAVTL